MIIFFFGVVKRTEKNKNCNYSELSDYYGLSPGGDSKASLPPGCVACVVRLFS